MRKTIALLMALLLVLSLGLSACGNAAANTNNASNGSGNANEAEPTEPPATAESLIKGYSEKIKAGTGAVYNTEMSLKMSITALGMDHTMEMTGTLKTESKGDLAHVTGNITTVEDGETTPVDMNAWTVKNGDSVTTYMDSDGTWYKYDSRMAGYIDSFQSLMITKDYSGLALSEDGGEYIVKGTVSVDALIDMLNGLMGEMGDMGDFEGVDLSKAVPAKVEYRFDKATKDLVYCEMDLKDCYQSIMEELVKTLVEALSNLGEDGEAGEDGQDIFSGMDLSSLITVETEVFNVKTTDIKLDPDLKLELPEEAKNAQAAPADLDDDETIEGMARHGIEEMTILLPEEFNEEAADGYTAAFYDGSETVVLILREDKSSFTGYAANMDDYLKLLIKANESKGIKEAAYENGRPIFEYDAVSNGVTYRYYTAVYESGKAYWLVQFATTKDDYDALRPALVTLANTVAFTD